MSAFQRNVGDRESNKTHPPDDITVAGVVKDKMTFDFCAFGAKWWNRTRGLGRRVGFRHHAKSRTRMMQSYR